MRLETPKLVVVPSEVHSGSPVWNYNAKHHAPDLSNLKKFLKMPSKQHHEDQEGYKIKKIKKQDNVLEFGSETMPKP